MKLRSLHRYLAVGIALPAGLMIGSGLLLQLRQDVEWIQPATRKGTPGLPTLSLSQIFDRAQQAHILPLSSEDTHKDPHPEWKDVSNISVLPAQGVVSVRFKDGFEVQVDGASGQVLHAAFRRTSLLIELHQGSFFHPLVMRWIFFPAGLGFGLLWLSGLLIFFRRRKKANEKNGNPRLWIRARSGILTDGRKVPGATLVPGLKLRSPQHDAREHSLNGL